MTRPDSTQDWEWADQGFVYAQESRQEDQTMEYLVGLCLALCVSAFATVVGFDRDRAFYPAVLIVVASYYCLFAVIAGSVHALVVEVAIFALFLAVSVLGFKLNLWIVVTALAAHGIMDFFHGHLVENPGLPKWWPMFCMTFDLVAAAYLAFLFRGRNAGVSQRRNNTPEAI